MFILIKKKKKIIILGIFIEKKSKVDIIFYWIIMVINDFSEVLIIYRLLYMRNGLEIFFFFVWKYLFYN